MTVRLPEAYQVSGSFCFGLFCTSTYTYGLSLCLPVAEPSLNARLQTMRKKYIIKLSIIKIKSLPIKNLTIEIYMISAR